MDKKCELNGVKMLPFALAALTINVCSGDERERREYRFVELSEKGFAIRDEQIVDFSEQCEMTVSFWKYDINAYVKTELINWKLIMREKVYPEKIDSENVYADKIYDSDIFWYEYTFIVEDEIYVKRVQELFVRYGSYVRKKLEYESSELSADMCGYPLGMEDEFWTDFDTQKKEMFRESMMSTQFCSHDCIMSQAEAAVVLDRPKLYDMFLSSKSMEEFMKEYWATNFIEESLLTQYPISRVYVGNQFCHLLFPEDEYLLLLLDEILKKQLGITVVFTYLREELIDRFKLTMECVLNWCMEKNQVIEIVVNDWGMLSILSDMSSTYFVLRLGCLLNKRRKDPRIKYKLGIQSEENRNMLMHNNLELPLFNNWLSEMGIEGYETESDGYLRGKFDMAAGVTAIHLPFYQTNTSQYCPLYAIVKYGDRGKQRLVKNIQECGELCREHSVMYPKHLKMVGRYNSIFGYDNTVLRDGRLQELFKSGVKRVVFDFL